jgi:hypothetical protein
MFALCHLSVFTAFIIMPVSLIKAVNLEPINRLNPLKIAK